MGKTWCSTDPYVIVDGHELYVQAYCEKAMHSESGRIVIFVSRDAVVRWPTGQPMEMNGIVLQVALDDDLSRDEFVVAFYRPKRDRSRWELVVRAPFTYRATSDDDEVTLPMQVQHTPLEWDDTIEKDTAWEFKALAKPPRPDIVIRGRFR